VHLRDASEELLVTVPLHGGRDLGRGLVQSILKQAGFSVDDYLRFR
jgi:predicted RNA binding protein YcfA (HicA-like mRNA interferase family)